MGNTTWSAKFQANESAWNRLERSPLAVPTALVREMRGKKAARAAPMLALADFKRLSACSTSGR
jgi:hypothetical protein